MGFSKYTASWTEINSFYYIVISFKLRGHPNILLSFKINDLYVDDNGNKIHTYIQY